MVKLLGALLILSGGAMVWTLRQRERRRQRDTLSDLLAALGRMGEEIRLARTPLPRLLEGLSRDCGPDAAALFRASAAAAARGEGLAEAWREAAGALPLDARDREALEAMAFYGDEETVCKEISLAAGRLARSMEEWERRRPEEDKRAAALCFSASALLVILLI